MAGRGKAPPANESREKYALDPGQPPASLLGPVFNWVVLNDSDPTTRSPDLSPEGGRSGYMVGTEHLRPSAGVGAVCVTHVGRESLEDQGEAAC